jgi:hypothetical protein
MNECVNGHTFTAAVIVTALASLVARSDSRWGYMMVLVTTEGPLRQVSGSAFCHMEFATAFLQHLPLQSGRYSRENESGRAAK